MDNQFQNENLSSPDATAGTPEQPIAFPDKDKLREYSNLTLTNNFMFCKVMSDPEICKEFLEVMLKIKIDRLEYINYEQEISEIFGMKTVRLDVYVDDGTRMFDIEMQMVDTKDLPKRARFYQSMLDISQFKKNMLYMQLKESYVIFLMPEDHFKDGLSCYTFENICRENPKIKLDDKTTKIFYNFNDYAKESDEGIKGILKYFATGAQTGGVTDKMQDLLEEARKSAVWITDYIMYEHNKNLIAYEAQQKGYEQGKELGIKQGLEQGLEQGRRQGLEQGLAQGQEQARHETAANLLKMGLSPEQVAQAVGFSIDEAKSLTIEKIDS